MDLSGLLTANRITVRTASISRQAQMKNCADRKHECTPDSDVSLPHQNFGIS